MSNKKTRLKSSHRTLSDLGLPKPKVTIDPPAPSKDETPGSCMDSYFKLFEARKSNTFNQV
jgi:hypothetical protein